VSADDDLDARLARLARATEAIQPSPGFSARVMDALPSETSWLAGVSGSSRRFLSLAAVLAVGAVAWAAHGETSMDDALAATYGAVDVDGE
jgi:hypothetical protein